MSTCQSNPKRNAPAFSFADIVFPFQAFGHMLRTSGPDINAQTIKRFFTAKHGNKERFSGIAAAIGIDPIVLQHLIHTTEGDYRWLGDGKVLLVRDFDLFVRCSAELGHRGEGTPALHFRCFPHDAFSAQPERYGECPFGKWEDKKDTAVHYNSIDRFAEQVPGVEKIIDEHFEQYIGKTEEIGELMRLLVWNVFSYTTYGVQPSEVTASMNAENDENLGEFDYAVRMSGPPIPYEWSPSLTARIARLEEWSKSVVDDRIKNLNDVGDQPDVLTDNLLHHPTEKYKLEGMVRGCYSGGHNSSHCSISGALVFNSLNNDAVYNYLMEDPETNCEHIAREALRLYSAVPTSRTVQEEDDFYLDGKKLEAGTLVLMSTYAMNTDPLSWEEPMKFDASRFKGNMDTIGYATQKGFAPFGASAPNVGIGGRPCSAMHYGIHVVRTILGKVLRDYKLTPTSGGYFDFQQNCGNCRYKGKCLVKIEKR